MFVDDLIRWFHLLAAAVWIGGMIVVASIVPALRKSGAERRHLQAAARRFGAVAWVALTLSAVTGVLQLYRLQIEVRGNTTLMVKLLLVGLAVGIAFTHQELARDANPAVRGAMEGMLLLIGLGILTAAVAL